MFYELAAVCVVIITSVILYYKWKFQYWQKRGLEYMEPSIPFGNTKKLFTAKVNFGQQFAEFYNYFKAKGLRHGGVFLLARPFYVPVDTTIVKAIIQKDFQNFVNRGFYINEEIDPLTGHLFSLEGTKWKNLRAKLTATFTSGKMKMMFDTLADCSKGLEGLMEEVTKTKEGLDIKEILARFTTDVIGSCAFGLETNSIVNPDAEFRIIGKRIFENTLTENLKNLVQFVFPPSLLNLIRFKTTKPDVEKFMLNVVKNTVDYREKNNIYRKDFLHLLLQLKNRGKLADDENIKGETTTTGETGFSMKFNELAAQVYVFFIAGFETSSTTMTFALYELAKNPDIQDKLRHEIRTVLKKHNNKLCYEAIMEMTYMDKVINESLRKYPPVPFLNRQCTIPYDVPDSNIHLEKDTMVVIPVLGIHMDPEFYPDPEKFDPERFNDENKNSRGPGLTWMPFGEGPRICIGLRFGVMQSKVGLTALLNNYRVKINKKTQEPLRMDPTTFITTTDTGIWLDVEKLDN